MKQAIWLLSVVSGASLLFMGCQKEPLNHLSADEARIYITDHDPAINFDNYKTYSISDSVAVIKNGKAKKEFNKSDSTYISAVKKYMGTRGYTLVSSKENPDLGINVNEIISTQTGIISYNDYWYGYGGYWDPYYWGYGGLGYYIPYAYNVYQISEGAMSVDILDLKNAKTNNKIGVIWTGLIRGPGIFNENIADSQVKALFDQSPYLKTN